MPAFLQPKAPFAADAIVVGDPGRALLLAQELLEQPKMCNHARGLWGYSGTTANGAELTIQSTGVGAPSAAAVLADLAELGVRRAVRVGTATGLDGGSRPGDLLLVAEAEATEGSSSVFGLRGGEAVTADAELLERLARELADDARIGRIVSVDTVPGPATVAAGAVGADMQTVAVLARGRALGMATAALLVVTDTAGAAPLDAEPLEEAAKRAGRAAAGALSP